MQGKDNVGKDKIMRNVQYKYQNFKMNSVPPPTHDLLGTRACIN